MTDDALEIRLPDRLDRDALSAFRSDVARLDGHAVAVIRGASDQVFCRGVSFEEIASVDPDQRAAGLDDFVAAATELLVTGTATVACVRGVAMGGGLGIAAACDVVLADEGARFALPEPLFGLIPGLVLPLVRTRVTAPAIRRLALGGDSIGAAEAHRLGLVDEVHAASDLDARVAGWVRRLRRVERGAAARLKSWLADMDCVASQILRGRDHLDELLGDDVVLSRVTRYQQGMAPWEDDDHERR